MPKGPYFRHFGGFWEAQNNKKSRKFGICAFRNPQNTLKTHYFGLAILWEAPNGPKITKICNFRLSGIREVNQKTNVFAILKIFGKPKSLE